MAKKWHGFRARGPLPPLTDSGKKLLGLKVGESLVLPPKPGLTPPADLGPSDIAFGGVQWRVEPLIDGHFKFTRTA